MKVMKLTVEDLKRIIEAVVKEMDEKGLKGLSGYPEDENEGVKPKGYSKNEKHDHTTETCEPNRYKVQGKAGFGPFTAAEGVRAIARHVVREHFNIKPFPNKKMESSAPFNSAAVAVGRRGSVGNVSIPEWKSTKSAGGIWEDLGRWYLGEERPKSAKRRKHESNIMQGVYGSRVSERKKKR